MHILDTIAERDYIGFESNIADHSPNYKAVPEFLDFDKKAVSQLGGVAQTSVRYDSDIPHSLALRLEETANIVNRVVGLFDGNLKKAALWFRTPNPMLGEVRPRDMLRMNRYKRLAKFIDDAARAQ